MAVSLSDHFTYKKLFKAVLPSIFMMVFTSIYSIVDGVFVSNFVGTTAFASVNLIMPFLMILSAIGFMMGAGGSALVAKTLGEGDRQKANQIFSMVIKFTFIIGIVVSVIGFVFIKQIALLLGATEQMLDFCVVYGRILIAFIAIFMLQNTFQSMFVVAEKPMLGFVVIVNAGVINMILDALFMAAFGWGLVGAAVATAISCTIGGVVPLFYFSNKNNKSLLTLTKTKIKFGVILQSCFNGSSELLTNISASIVSMLFNMQLLKFAGENGVAAYGVIMYAGFIFAAIFIGYFIGSAPLFGYNHGAKNHAELKNLLKKSIILIISAGAIMTVFTELLALPMAKLFGNSNSQMIEITTNGIRIYGLSFLICGINMFASAFFTALNNGLISAIISFERTLLFQTATIVVLPIWFGINGVWLSVVVAEVLALIVTFVCFVANKKKYQY